MACWSTKAAISLKRVKIDEKLLWRAYRPTTTTTLASVVVVVAVVAMTLFKKAS